MFFCNIFRVEIASFLIGDGSFSEKEPSPIRKILYKFKKFGKNLYITYLSEVNMNNPLDTQKDYQEYVNQKSPNSPILKNCFNAFWVGGLICSIGQIIMDVCKYRGLSQESSGTIVSIILIAISAFLTGLNIFNKIGKFAGAGSLIPITGFANSIVSPAMEYKSEGYIMGVGGKMFTVAGPVLVFGISASIIVGLVYLIFNTQAITLV